MTAKYCTFIYSLSQPFLFITHALNTSTMKNIILPPPSLKKLNLATPCVIAMLLLFVSNSLPGMNRDTVDRLALCERISSAPSGTVINTYADDPCMGEVFDITLNNGYRVSTNNPLGVQWTGKRIKIANGATIYFDRNVNMIGCDILGGLLSKIIVEGSNTLTTSNSQFKGCTQMWTGIQVATGASVQLSNTYFYNALRALDFLIGHNQLASSITNCNFVANNTGIQVGTNTMGGVSFLLSAFTGNTFTGGNLLSPQVGFKSYAGMTFTRCPIGIVSPGNKFVSLKAGIVSSTSTVIAWKCQFEGMIEDHGWGGYGISTTSSAFGVSECKFSNNQKRGVWSLLAKGLYVGKTFFDSEGEYGVFSESNFNPANIWIENDTFYLRKARDVSAIHHERSPSSATVGSSNRILGNRITVFDQPTRIMNMSLVDVTCLNGGSDEFPIRENNITTNPRKSPMHGIYIRGNSSRLGIAKNFVLYGGFPKPDGIVANLGIAVENVNGDYNRLDSNQVYSTLYSAPFAGYAEASSFIKCGIHDHRSPNFKICANITDNTYRGFHFEGNINYCDFAINNIGHHWHGIDCQMAGGTFNDMGKQDWHQNRWLSSYVGFGANYRDTTFAPFKFRVDPTVPFNVPPSINISDWFSFLSTESSNSSCVRGSEPSGPMINDSDEAVMAGTYPAYSAAGAWDVERELLLKLERNSGLMPSGSAAKVFYDSKAGSSSLQFAKAQKLYENVYAFPVGNQSSLNSLFAQQKILLDSMRVLCEALVVSAAAKQALANQIQANGDAIDLQLTQINTFKANALAQAETWNATLTSATPFESNLKNVFILSVKAAKGDSLTEADYNILRSIANQCPLTGGQAVRIAPYRLPHDESIAYLSEGYSDNNCNSQRPGTRTHGREPFAQEVLLSPNPAVELLTLFLSEPVSGQWTIINLNGQVVAAGDVPEGILSFDVPLLNLVGGIYFLQLREKNALITSQKFIVIH
jgi:hypothetical protein